MIQMLRDAPKAYHYQDFFFFFFLRRLFGQKFDIFKMNGFT